MPIHARRLLLPIVLLALAALYAPLATNPGWFSHDELQWGGRATVAHFGALPWVDWTDVDTFQWRPLTFNLWLVLAWIGFASPPLMHTLWLLLGAGVTLLLYSCLRKRGASRSLAAGGAVAFALSPFAVYVHGWTATLADLLWVGLALALTRGVLGCDPCARRAPFAIALVATSLALLSKEAALAIAPLLALAWWLSSGERRWRAACLGAALPTVLYLALRVPLLLFGERPDGAYGWSPGAVPLRWAEMQLWPLLVTTFELSGVAQASLPRLLIAGAILVSAVFCVTRAWPRAGLALLAGSALAIGPALVLLQAYPQYGYGHAALTCACFALAWPRLGRGGRIFPMLALLLSTWHGANIQRELRRVGELQAVFTPAIARLQSEMAAPKLIADRQQDAWIYRRLMVPVLPQSPPPLTDGRSPDATLVVEPAAATHRIEAGGAIVALDAH